VKDIELYTPWSLRGIELSTGSRLELARNLARLVLSSTVNKVLVQSLNETTGEYALLLGGTLERQGTSETKTA